MIDKFFNQKKLCDLADNTDDQSAELLCSILDYFRNKLTPDEKTAYNMLDNLINSSFTDQDINRNQIFKTADLLKIKLPSYSF